MIPAMQRSRIFTGLLAAATAATGALVLTASPAAAETTVVNFGYTAGGQAFIVPAGVTQIVVETWGAQGGTGEALVPGQLTTSEAPGLGGYARSTLSVTPGEELSVVVGGRGGSGNAAGGFFSAPGFNGGAPGSGGALATVRSAGGAGGGASDVRRGGFLPEHRVVVAGGGGGAGGGAAVNPNGPDNFVVPGGYGGDAGGLVGETSGPVGGTNFVAQGGRQDAGGAGGTSTGEASANGDAGVAFEGGDAGFATLDTPEDGERIAGGGGGGGGWFGGGGGGAGVSPVLAVGAGGGGGSSFGQVTEPGVRAGNGLVRITYTTDQQPDAAIKSGGAFVGEDVYNLDGSGQTVTKPARRNQEVSYRVRIQNDGDDPYAFRVGGPASDARFSIRYKASGVDVTGAVTTGSFVTPLVEPDTSFIVVIKVKPNLSATVGTVKPVLLSVIDGSLRDAVKARTKVIAG
jgi:hypothetical protein